MCFLAQPVLVRLERKILALKAQRRAVLNGAVGALDRARNALASLTEFDEDQDIENGTADGSQSDAASST